MQENRSPGRSLDLPGPICRLHQAIALAIASITLALAGLQRPTYQHDRQFQRLRRSWLPLQHLWPPYAGTGRSASVVSQTDGVLSKTARARRTLAKISSALAVHTKPLSVSL